MKSYLNRKNNKIIWIEPEDKEEAIQVSQLAINEKEQWTLYNRQLALNGFKRCLNDKIPDSKIAISDFPFKNTFYCNVVNTICKVNIGEFKVCLIVHDNLDDALVKIPREFIDIPCFASQFYVSLEVFEESEKVFYRGGIRYDQLVEYKGAGKLEYNLDWNYELPISYFDSDFNHLLIYLNRLNPQAIALPAVISQPSIIQKTTLKKLENLLAKGQSLSHRLWKHISWEEWETILCNSELVNLLYQWEAQPNARQSYLEHIQQFLIEGQQQAINVAAWLKGQLDDVARSVGWTQPVLINASGWRSIDDFAPAIATFQKKGRQIPSTAFGACHKFTLDQINLEILGATWLHTETSPLEWSLLIILRNQSEGFLPKGIRIIIRDQEKILSDKTLDRNEQYCFRHLIGKLEDKFEVVIELNGKKEKLIPFTFDITQIAIHNPGWRSECPLKSVLAS